MAFLETGDVLQQVLDATTNCITLTWAGIAGLTLADECFCFGLSQASVACLFQLAGKPIHAKLDKVFGKDIKRESIAIRRRIGYLAQNPVFYDHMTARETLRYKLGFFFKGPRDKIEERIQETLQLVGLADKKDMITSSMTLSDRRLLELARALASRPLIALLDEPMAGLNPSEINTMLKVIEKARKEKNVAILWVEHKVDAIFRLCDRVAVLDYGRLIAEGKPEEIANNSEVIEAYLGKASS